MYLLLGRERFESTEPETLYSLPVAKAMALLGPSDGSL